MPIVPEMRAIWDAMRPFYQSVMNGELEPAEAAAAMQERAGPIAEMGEVSARNEAGAPRPPGPLVPAAVAAGAGGRWSLPLPVQPVDLADQLEHVPLPHPPFQGLTTTPNLMTRAGRPSGVPAPADLPDFGDAWTVNLVFHFTLGVGAALLLNRRLPGRGCTARLLIMPWAVPAYITALTWRGMFDYEYGAVNLLLGKPDRHR